MNQQPKTSYQDFLKDIYSAMKKINQTTGDIFAKLDTLDARIANLEKGYVLLSEDIKKLMPNTNYNHANLSSDTGITPAKQTGASKLLSLLTQLNDSTNDISDTGMDVYTLGTNTALETVFTNPKPSPLFNTVCTGIESSAPNVNSTATGVTQIRRSFCSLFALRSKEKKGGLELSVSGMDGFHSPDAEDNYGSVTADISPVRLPFGSSITQNNVQDDFMILE